ncbi:MAG: hypothetical protein AAGA95_16925 [Pseudomonadota bacterium]
MSSSTSSSDARAQRRLFGRVLLTVLLGMGIALALVRGFAVAAGAGSQSLLGRVLLAQAALPRIAEEKDDLVMFYGSSMVQAGFSPREFDQHIADMGGATTSFNFGFGGLNPLFQDYQTRRIRESLQTSGRRLKLAFIEFNPFQTTVTRRERARAIEESYIALLASPQELWDIVLDDPERGLRMLGIRYLRDGISAEMITTFFWAEPFQAPRAAPNTELKEEEGVAERLREVGQQLQQKLKQDYPDFDNSDWYYPWRGGGTIKAERSAEALALVDEFYTLTQTDYRMAVDRLQRIDSADIEELHFDPELVSAFVRMVKNLQQVADRVEVVMLPKNTDWIKNSPEALARQAEVLQQLETATGVTVRDWQQIDVVSNDMFGDTTHLNRYEGAVAFTRFVAEQYGPYLSGSR